MANTSDDTTTIHISEFCNHRNETKQYKKLGNVIHTMIQTNISKVLKDN